MLSFLGDLVTLAFIAPALLFPSPWRVAAAAAALLIWAAINVVTGRRLYEPTPLDPAIALLALVTLIDAFTTYDVSDSLGKLAGVALGICAYYATSRHVGRVFSVQTALTAYAIAGFLLAGILLGGTAWAGKWGPLIAIARRLPVVIRGLPGAEQGFHPNAAAGVLLLFLPVQMAWAVTTPVGARAHASIPLLGRLLVLGVGLATLLLTQSRAAWMGFAVACVGWAMLKSVWARRAGAIVLFAAVVSGVIYGPRAAFEALIAAMGPQADLGVFSRFELQQRGVNLMAEVPLTGVGLNGFRRVVPALYTPLTAPTTVDLAHAHNQLIQAAADLGIAGLVAFLAIWIGAAFMLLVVHRRSMTRPHRQWVAEGIGVALAAEFLFGFSDVIPLGSKVGVVFWLLLALCAAMCRDAVQTVHV